ISQGLQRAESHFILERVGPALLRELPNMPWLTVHDSVICPAAYATAVRNIMLEEFAVLDVHPTLRLTYPPTWTQADGS
ncbi:unnamed protein product, partial [marine sediment metagenome]